MIENSLSTREKREKHAIYNYDMFLWCFSVCVWYVVLTFFIVFMYIFYFVWICACRICQAKNETLIKDNLNGSTSAPFFHMNIFVRLNDKYIIWKISCLFCSLTMRNQLFFENKISKNKATFFEYENGSWI